MKIKKKRDELGNRTKQPMNIHLITRQVLECDWNEFGRRFSRFVTENIDEDAFLVNTKGHQVEGSTPYYDFGDGIRWYFCHDGVKCRSIVYALPHPNLIVEAMMGYGRSGDDGADEFTPPRIAMFNICAARKWIPRQDDHKGKGRFVLKQILLSIIYLFRMESGKKAVYRQIRTNGIIHEPDTLELSEQYLGSVLCQYATMFQTCVIDGLQSPKPTTP